MQQDSTVIIETMTFEMFKVGKTHCSKNIEGSTGLDKEAFVNPKRGNSDVSIQYSMLH